jgi:hypothetical protein
MYIHATDTAGTYIAAAAAAAAAAAGAGAGGEDEKSKQQHLELRVTGMSRGLVHRLLEDGSRFVSLSTVSSTDV